MAVAGRSASRQGQGARPCPERFVRDHYALVLRITEGLCMGDAELAAELTQMAFERTLRHFEAIDSNRRAYVVRVARNLCADHWRRERTRRAASERLRAELPAARDMQLSARIDISKAMARLAQEHPAAFELLCKVEIEGMSVTELARIEGCRPATMRMRLHRARGLIRQEDEHG